MPEAGFAPTAAETAETAVQEPAAAQPSSPVDSVTRLAEEYKNSLSDLHQTRLDLSRFSGISRDGLLKTVMLEVLGQRPLAEFLTSNSIRQMIAENHHNTLAPVINEKMKGLMGGVANDLMSRAVKNYAIGATVDQVIADPAKFLTWLDMLVRQVLQKFDRFSPPASIIFEIKNVDLPAKSIRLLVIWGDGPLDGMHRNMQLSVKKFPWIGRAALVMPEGADEAKKKEIEELRQLYVFAIIRSLAEFAS